MVNANAIFSLFVNKVQSMKPLSKFIIILSLVVISGCGYVNEDKTVKVGSIGTDLKFNE